MNEKSASLPAEPVSRSFVLVTEGKDPELDALGIILEATRGLQGEELRRIFKYLLDRFTLPGGLSL